jgi:hypothetical protein
MTIVLSAIMAATAMQVGKGMPRGSEGGGGAGAAAAGGVDGGGERERGFINPPVPLVKWVHFLYLKPLVCILFSTGAM